jgi:diguanylate cyclase (GGDEF)-like protein
MSKLSLRVLVCIAAIAVGVAVWLGAEVQRDSAIAHADHVAATEQMLTSALDRQNDVRGYMLTGDAQFIADRANERRAFDDAVAQLRAVAQDDPRVAAGLDAVLRSERRWRQAQDETAAGWTDQSFRRTVASTRQGEDLLRALRHDLLDLRDQLDAAGRADERTSALTTVVLALLTLLLVAGVGAVILRRRMRAEAVAVAGEQAFRDQQAELSRALLSAESEAEAHGLLKRYLERDGRRTVTVLGRDADRERLLAYTALPEDSPLSEALAAGAAPRDCIAIRQAATHEESAAGAPLLRCDLCGASGPDRLCAPLVVSSEVIGSVLSVNAPALDDHDRRRVGDAVTIAAPVLANLRTIAVAQSRATTDALTGLPNRRALDDTLGRMVAQALRSSAPLAVIAVDLDHFKAVNDELGHETGDEVLEAVATALRSGTRISDFVARWGGEEFCVLAPDTPATGAAQLAETLRAAVSRLSVPGVPRPLTASFGIALCPEHATSAELLLRQADRALYAAKHAGRDRVVVAELATPA